MDNQSITHTRWNCTYHIRMVSHNDNCNYSTSKKRGKFFSFYNTLVYRISWMFDSSIWNTLIFND